MSGELMDALEYGVLFVTLALSALIGIYFGCVRTTGQNTVAGYLFGGKQMPVIPVSLSLVSSFISGITLIGVPSEVYYFGTQYLVIVFGVFLAAVVQVYVSLPVFFKLQTVSAFEYMELRFGRMVRTVTSFLYCLFSITHSAIVIYGPALALNQVTGLDSRIISAIVSAVCIFYAAVGGVKAVVWTDTLQLIIMVFSLLAVLIIGTIKSGGSASVLEAALQGDRIRFFEMDPSARISFWSQTLGMTTFAMATTAFNPPVIQRLISLPSIEGASLSSWLMAVGIIFFYAACGCLGLVMYAYYRNCDPYTANMISRPDQILPYFVMDISKFVNGLCGLFLAGIVSAALSSLSTNINTLAGTIYEDFIEIRLKKKPTEKKASTIMKFTSCVVGVICVVLVGLVEKIGYMVEIAAGSTGITQGAILGLFILGIFLPRANNLGATVGGLVSLLFMTIMLIGNTVSKMSGAITNEHGIMNMSGCPSNVTRPHFPKNDSADYVFPLFRIPVFYYTTIGSLIVVIVGSLASLFSPSEIVNPDCLSPWINKFARKFDGKDYNAIRFKEKMKKKGDLALRDERDSEIENPK